MNALSLPEFLALCALAVVSAAAGVTLAVPLTIESHGTGDPNE